MNAALLASIRGARKDDSDDDSSSPPPKSVSAPKPAAAAPVAPKPSGASSSSSDASGPFAAAEPTLREQLMGYVDQLKSGKPPKVINMVMKSALPPNSPWRAKVFVVAGIPDPEGGASAPPPAPAAPPKAPPQASSAAASSSNLPNAIITLSREPSVPLSSAPPMSRGDSNSTALSVRSPNTSPPTSPRESGDGKKKDKDKKKSKGKSRKELEAERITTITVANPSALNDQFPPPSTNVNLTQPNPKSSAPGQVSGQGHTRNISSTFDTDAARATSGQSSGISPTWLLAIVMLTGVLNAMDATIIFPVLWSNVIARLKASELSYGLVAGAYNTAQALSAPLLGMWTDARNMKEVLLFCSLFSLVGNSIYFLGNSQDDVMLLLIGRGLAGIGAGVVLISYGHLTRISERLLIRQERLELYAWLVRVGQILAPGIGALVDISENAGAFSVYSIPPLIMITLFGISLVVQFVHAILTRDDPVIIPSYGFALAEDMERTATRAVKEQGPCSRDSLLFGFVYFVHVFAYWSFMAAVLPFLNTAYGYATRASYLYFLMVGGIFVLAFFLFRVLKQQLPELRLVALSLLISASGLMFLTHEGEATKIALWQIIVSTVLLVCGFCIGTLILPLIYADLIGMRLENVGLRAGVFFGIASLAMGVGPIWGALGAAAYSFGVVAFVAFIALIVSMVLVICRPSSAEATVVEGMMPAVRAELGKGLLAEEYRI